MLRAASNTVGGKLNASYNDYTHSEFPTAQDATGVSDPQANHFHKREFNGVLQVQQQPAGKLQGTLGLWTNIESLTIEGDAPLEMLRKFAAFPEILDQKHRNRAQSLCYLMIHLLDPLIALESLYRYVRKFQALGDHPRGVQVGRRTAQE